MKSNLRTALVLVVTTILIIGGVILVKQPWNNSAGVSDIDVVIDPDQPAPAVGSLAPDFAGVTIDDEVIRLSDLAGKPAWLIFGATWCTNCRAEAPDVEAAAQEYDGQVRVLSIYVGESVDTVSGYASRLKMTHTQIPDPVKEIASTYGVMGLPTHVFIDSHGVIQKITMGSISKKAASEVLDSLL
ncbi:MAG: TlpA family protein disulfide reductase [Propionibacteriaceae bacterium]|jgi:thiol-disulfide isomerase/thioredoxin|nr:TlpA family protein disulfide reductase [Propionibacteriaceae bacterium]